MRVKDTHANQLIMLTNHRENRTYILHVAKVHSVIDTALNGVKQQFGALTGGIDQLQLLVTDVVSCIYEYAAYQQGDSCNYDAGCQAFEQGGLLVGAANRSERASLDIFELFFIGAEKVEDSIIETHNFFRVFFGWCLCNRLGYGLLCREFKEKRQIGF